MCIRDSLYGAGAVQAVCRVCPACRGGGAQAPAGRALSVRRLHGRKQGAGAGQTDGGRAGGPRDRARLPPAADCGIGDSAVDLSDTDPSGGLTRISLDWPERLRFCLIPRGVSCNAYLRLDGQTVLSGAVDWPVFRQSCEKQNREEAGLPIGSGLLSVRVERADGAFTRWSSRRPPPGCAR